MRSSVERKELSNTSDIRNEDESFQIRSRNFKTEFEFQEKAVY